MDGKPPTCHFTVLSPDRVNRVSIPHALWLYLSVLTLLGRELLDSLGTIKQVGHVAAPYFDSDYIRPTKRARSCSQSYSTRSGPAFWDLGGPRRALNTKPETISLRPESTCPSKRQYPTKLETKKGLQAFVDQFFTHGLLVPSSLHAIVLLFRLLSLLGILSGTRPESSK